MVLCQKKVTFPYAFKHTIGTMRPLYAGSIQGTISRNSPWRLTPQTVTSQHGPQETIPRFRPVVVCSLYRQLQFTKAASWIQDMRKSYSSLTLPGACPRGARDLEEFIKLNQLKIEIPVFLGACSRDHRLSNWTIDFTRLQSQLCCTSTSRISLTTTRSWPRHISSAL